MNSVNTRPYHHGNLREEMIAIAVRLTAEHGPEGLRLRGVASEAGVSPSAAYRHFSGLDGLLEEVRARAMSALAARMREAVDRVGHEGAAVPSGAGGAAGADAVGVDVGTAPMRRLVAAGRGYVDFALRDPLLFGCLAGGAFPLEGDWEGTPLGDLLHLVEDAQPGIDEEEASAHAVALWSMVHGFAILCTQGALKGLDVQRREALLEQSLALAVRGLPQ